MGINISAANNQAAQITAYAGQLRSSKTQLLNYKASLEQNWQGKEILYITQGIDAAISKIDAAIRSLESLGADVKSAANAIKKEEEAAAAAAAARAAKQRRVDAARAELNSASDELDAAQAEYNEIARQIKNTKNKMTLASLNEKYRAARERLEAARDNCEACRRALDMAGR